jgi:hypothetical protein
MRALQTLAVALQTLARLFAHSVQGSWICPLPFRPRPLPVDSGQAIDTTGCLEMWADLTAIACFRQSREWMWQSDILLDRPGALERISSAKGTGRARPVCFLLTMDSRREGSGPGQNPPKSVGLLTPRGLDDTWFGHRRNINPWCITWYRIAARSLARLPVFIQPVPARD